MMSSKILKSVARKGSECHWHFCVNIGLASLHLAQNYFSSVPKILQSWCSASRAFYQTSLLILCNVFCHVHERSLKWLEIDNISSVSKHEPKSSDKFFHFHLQMDEYWYCDSHNWIILFRFMKPKSCAFHVSFNVASWCKSMINCEYRWLSIFSYQNFFISIIMTLCVCLITSVFGGRPNVFCRWFHAPMQFIICL